MAIKLFYWQKIKTAITILAKMSSIALQTGFIMCQELIKQLLKNTKKILWFSTGSLYGEVPSKILNIGEKQAEEALVWWKETFGDDLYVEVSRHNQEDEKRVNSVLIPMAKKHQVKLVPQIIPIT